MTFTEMLSIIATVLGPVVARLEDIEARVTALEEAVNR